MRRRRAAILLAAVGLLGGCSGPIAVGTSGPAGTSRPSSGVDPAEAALTYGYAPYRDPRVTYQPDVVFVQGGPAIIRWASANGLIWAIDRNAVGAADLKVDSVMFATSRAVGRVIDLSDEGDTRIVSLAPVDLTDLISTAELDLGQAVDLSSMAYQDLVQVAGTASDPDATPSPATGSISLPQIRLVAARSGSGDAGSAMLAGTTVEQLPPATKVCQEVTVGPFVVKPCFRGQNLVVGVDYKKESGGLGNGLKFGGAITFRMANPRATAHVSIENGRVVDSTVRLDGLTGVDVSLGAGAINGATDNAKIKIEVPLEVEMPIPPSPATFGLPLNLVFELKFIVATALSGNNSTLEADGAYALTGPIGFAAGAVIAPQVTVTRSIIDSLRGVTLGASGVVFAMKFKLHFGLGMEGMVAGPYATFTLSAGVSKGSVLGSPLATCLGATLGFWIGAGAGLTFDVSRFETFFPKALRKIKLENEQSWNVYTLKQTIPDVPLCRG